MPRPRLPPTPLSSTDIVGRDKPDSVDMESAFVLPPAAVAPKETKSQSSKIVARSAATGQSSPPLSPNDTKAGSSLQRKRTSSGAEKPSTDVQSVPTQSSNRALPPPPSRSRKIIQMKPNQSTKEMDRPPSQVSNKESAVEASNAAPAASSKKTKGKNSSTSAAGRKIARKTAHSIIERRRRSKMNEEFGVLKDMIPACAGVEMHKLAILQAGIEYVRYLEGCIEQLKAQPEASRASRNHSEEVSVSGDEEGNGRMDIGHPVHDHYRLKSSSADASESVASSPSLKTRLPPLKSQKALPSFGEISATGGVDSSRASQEPWPAQSAPPQSVSTKYNAATYKPVYTAPEIVARSTSPPPPTVQTPLQTGISPAFGAFKFSPDLSRTSTWSYSNGQYVYNASPSILPLPQSMLPQSLPLPASASAYTSRASSPTRHGEGHAEATATAALMMMTKDRRGSVSTGRMGAGKGMSVKDLLTS